MGYRVKEGISCVLCPSKSIGRKLCRPHYNQMKKDGRLHEFPILGPSDVTGARYIKKESGCWEWTGTRNGYGYGIFLLPGEVPIRAHRYFYEQSNGPIPDGLVVMHTCDNPPCVNPDHLRVGTKGDNNRDRFQKKRGKFNEERKNTKLTKVQVIAILADKRRQCEIARQYGVNQSHISRIKHRHCGKYID